jgi:ADP-ribose pyrophosphatase YjhB (NUDIX family)
MTVVEGATPRPACVNCGFVLYLHPRLAAATIIGLEGGLVLLRRTIEPHRGKWLFPGGFVEFGEAIPDAAVRETWEEACLRVGLTGILDVYTGPDTDVALVVYAAHVLSGDLAAGDETDQARVFPPEAVPWDELAFDATRSALRDYVRRFFPRVRIPR